jgi:hypothetical protein
VVGRHRVAVAAVFATNGAIFATSVRWPARRLAALGAVAFCALLAEGSVGDWSAILLDRETEAGPSLAALGLAGFSLTMGFGRLAADPLAERFGRAAVVRGGGLLAGAGLALALAGPALIGLLSDATSLPAALALVAVLCLAAAALAGAAGGARRSCYNAGS